MKIKEKIRQKASQVFDVLIPEGQWLTYVNDLDRTGKFDRLAMLKMIMLLCEQVERFETMLEDIYFRLEILEGSRNATDIPVVAEVKLKKPLDIYAELDKLGEVPAYYISPLDWSVVTKDIKELGKEIDPKDGKEKTCVFYKEKAIFRE